MRYLIAILAVAALAGCGSEDPTQPAININGDGNFVQAPSGGTGQSITTPAPVVIPPVIVAPEAAAEDEG